MANYKVRPGDTLWGIARDNRIRYWPNIYFATQNNAFRLTHSNPNRIFPNEIVFIPSLSSIAPMESRPKIIHRNIPLFTQGVETCWRATGQMLYCRRNPGRNAEANFNSLIGSEYQNMTTGSRSSSWHDFYCARLGMREARIASPNDLHYIIATRGPAIVAVGDSSSKHSMVMAGYDLFLGRWLVLDPAAGEKLDYPDDEIIVHRGSPPPPKKEAKKEEEKVVTLTGYQTGPATWENMHRWLWILDHSVYQKVYHY